MTNTEKLNRRRARLANKGDVKGVYDSLLNNSLIVDDLVAGYEYLSRAIEVRAESDPAGFSDEMLQVLLGFTANLTLRVQLAAAKQLRRDDDNRHQCDGAIGVSTLVLDEFLPALSSLQNQLIDIAYARASIKRLWRLANAGSQKQSDTTPTSRTPKKSKPAGTNGKSNGKANGHNRVLQLFGDTNIHDG